jgi:2,3-bisphosphoglycerate-dependent phosphoglycerate mutase
LLINRFPKVCIQSLGWTLAKTEKEMHRNLIPFGRYFGILCALSLLTGGKFAYGEKETVSNAFTTVIVMRHADRNREGDLTIEGKRRALDLVHLLGTSGIKAIYTTDIQRTKDTAAPLAACLGLTPEVYGRNLNELSDMIFPKHRGEVVLVIGHDSTVPRIIERLIGKDLERSPDIQFDDLHIVTIDESGNGNLFSIRYGNPIKPTNCSEAPRIDKVAPR